MRLTGIYTDPFQFVLFRILTLILSFPLFQAGSEQFAWRPTVLTLKLNLNSFARFFKKRSHPRCSILLHAWKAQIGTELAGKKNIEIRSQDSWL
jgi:hypothetical protein